MGPNMKRLALEKAAKDAIPDGGGLAEGLAVFADPTKMLETVRASMKFAEQAVALVRQATEPNPWKVKTDEEIAGELLRRIEERHRQAREAYRAKKEAGYVSRTTQG